MKGYYLFLCLSVFLYDLVTSCSEPIYPEGYEPPEHTVGMSASYADIVLYGKVIGRVDPQTIENEDYMSTTLYDVEVDVLCTFKFDSYRDIDKDFKMPKKIVVKNAGKHMQCTFSLSCGFCLELKYLFFL